MNAVARAVFALALCLPAAWAGAETLRCNGAIAAEGDSKLSVLYKCGQPALAETYCAQIYAYGYPYTPPPVVPYGVPCQNVEEWLYDRGPGNLMATVRFRDGRVSSIRYERLPQ